MPLAGTASMLLPVIDRLGITRRIASIIKIVPLTVPPAGLLLTESIVIIRSVTLYELSRIRRGSVSTWYRRIGLV